MFQTTSYSCFDTDRNISPGDNPALQMKSSIGSFGSLFEKNCMKFKLFEDTLSIPLGLLK